MLPRPRVAEQSHHRPHKTSGTCPPAHPDASKLFCNEPDVSRTFALDRACLAPSSSALLSPIPLGYFPRLTPPRQLTQLRQSPYIQLSAPSIFRFFSFSSFPREASSCWLHSLREDFLSWALLFTSHLIPFGLDMGSLFMSAFALLCFPLLWLGGLGGTAGGWVLYGTLVVVIFPLGFPPTANPNGEVTR